LRNYSWPRGASSSLKQNLGKDEGSAEGEGQGEAHVLCCTGTLSPPDLAAHCARWARPVTLASADGMLGVAPAASFLLGTALLCLALRHGCVPASLTDGGRDCLVERAMISFQGAEGVATASLCGGTS